jgi:hypothetical protein
VVGLIPTSQRVCLQSGVHFGVIREPVGMVLEQAVV